MPDPSPCVIVQAPGDRRNKGRVFPCQSPRFPTDSPMIPQRFLGNPQRFQRFRSCEIQHNCALPGDLQGPKDRKMKGRKMKVQDRIRGRRVSIFFCPRFFCPTASDPRAGRAVLLTANSLACRANCQFSSKRSATDGHRCTQRRYGGAGCHLCRPVSI